MTEEVISQVEEWTKIEKAFNGQKEKFLKNVQKTYKKIQGIAAGKSVEEIESEDEEKKDD